MGFALTLNALHGTPYIADERCQLEDFISFVGGRELSRKLSRLIVMNLDHSTNNILRASC